MSATIIADNKGKAVGLLFGGIDFRFARKPQVTEKKYHERWDHLVYANPKSEAVKTATRKRVKT